MLRFIRSALHMLFLTVTVIPWSLTVVALSPFVSKQWLYGFCHVWVRMVVASARPLLGIRTRVRGLENLPAGPQAAAVLLVKHQSAWETFVLPTITPHPLAYVFKRELARIPFFGWVLARLNMVRIDRGRPTEAFTRMAAACWRKAYGWSSSPKAHAWRAASRANTAAAARGWPLNAVCPWFRWP